MSKLEYLLKSPYSADCGVILNFLHTDSEELFLQNKNLRGPGWEWYDKPLTYKMNSQGYRMDSELKDVNFDNYLAFFGCSFTVGIGLPKEDTFAYRIAKHYSMDYVNGAIGGSGVEFAMHNIVKLLTDAPHPPKAICIHWPDACRGLYWYKGNMHNFVPGAHNTITDPYWKEVYDYWGEPFEKTALEVSYIVNRFKLIRDAIRLICKQHRIPLFESGFRQFYPEVDTTGIDTIDWVMDFGRDIKLDDTSGHPNVYFHDGIFTKFNNFVQTNRLTLA